MSVAVVDQLEFVHIHDQQCDGTGLCLQYLAELIEGSAVDDPCQRIVLCTVAEHSFIGTVEFIDTVVGKRQILEFVGACDFKHFFFLDVMYINLQRLHDQTDDQNKHENVFDEKNADQELLSAHRAFEDK